MEQALARADDSAVLRLYPRLTFHSGKYSYEISLDAGHARFSVNDGRETISEPIQYAFGNGYVAQTYVLRHNAKLYEARVSYYSGINGLDWTLGDVQNAPTIEEAFGRDIDSTEARNCFSCHGTAAVVGNALQLDRLIPGVACEACHGPGARHVAAMRTGNGTDPYIFNPRTLDPDKLSQEFCGACHRGADSVGMMPGLGGINNVRFQPYRMSNSPGHPTNDVRFACTFCHDPHLALNKDATAYDTHCRSCHISAKGAEGILKPVSSSPGKRSPSDRKAKPCPVGKERCVSCHMPKVILPGAHFGFTDHRIRITRPGEKYPI